MKFRLLPILFLEILPVLSAAEVRVATFNIGAHFPAGGTYFDYSLGDPGTADYNSVRDVLARIDADVVALEEIHTVDLQGSPNDLQSLAGELGYSYVYVTPRTNAFDSSLQVAFLSRFPFLSTTAINSPPGAKELTRLHQMVTVDVPGTSKDLTLVAAHLKAGTATSDRFERTVAMKRLVGALGGAGTTENDNFVVLGDFNPSSTNTVFNSLPTSGLPGTYQLGTDITFPITYSTDMLSYFGTPAVGKLDPRQLDGSASTFGTTAPGGPVLDLMFVSPAIAVRPVLTEIYNSELDLSNATGLAKSGSPLADGTSAVASDHYAVFADVNLDDAGPYTFTAPGQTVTEDFSGFQGNNDPAPWSTGGVATWTGVDDGASGVEGLRSYGTAAEGSLGFLSEGDGATASAGFVNASPVPLTALRISYDAEQWRSAFNGTADVIHAELLTAGGTIPLPDLTFAASRSLPSGPVAGGATTTLTATAPGLSIPPGSAFQLRISFVPGTGGGVASSDVFVNEFHYDNVGTDVGEFVEIAVGPGYSGALSAISLYLYNGDGGVTYGSVHVLSSFTEGTPTASGHRFFYKLITTSIQNGNPDGFAVVNTTTSKVLHFISYGGVFTATNGPANGLKSTNIGVTQNAEPIGEAALGLTDTGASASDFTWTKFTGTPYSKGQPNAGQTSVASFLPSQGLAIDNLSVTFLTDTDLDGLPDISDPDDDNDGQPDAFETAFGADPLDAGSRFVPVINAARDLVFPGATGISYTIESSGNLSSWDFLSTHQGNGESIVVPLPATEPRRFFRVRSGN